MASPDCGHTHFDHGQHLGGGHDGDGDKTLGCFTKTPFFLEIHIELCRFRMVKMGNGVSLKRSCKMQMRRFDLESSSKGRRYILTLVY